MNDEFPVPHTLNGDPALVTDAPVAKPHDALRGPFGFRAGWSILIFTILMVVSLTLLTVVALAATGKLHAAIERSQKVHAAKLAGVPPPPMPPRSKEMGVRVALINEGGQALAILGVTAVMALIERRRIGAYFLGARHRLDLLPGALWGLVSMSALVGTLRALGLIHIDARLLYGTAAVKFGLAWLVLFALVGFGEEYLFRGYLLFTLSRGMMRLRPGLSPQRAYAIAFTVAAFLMSLLFFFAHTGNGGENAAGLAAVFLAGVVFCYALWRTGSLWWGIGFHMTWDWAQSFLFGVADSGQVSAHRLLQTHVSGNPLLSGGSAGPEGSLFVLPTLLLVMVVLHFTVRGRTLPLPQPSAGLPDPYLFTELPGEAAVL